MIRFLTLCYSIFVSLFTPLPSQRPTTNTVAKLENIKGVVRIRRSQRTNWELAKQNTSMFLGDRVFTGQGASAHIIYTVEPFVSISLPEWSFIEIQKDPLQKNHILRGLQSGSSSSVKQVKLDNNTMPDLQIARKLKPLLTLFPYRTGYVRAENLPVTYEVSIQDADNDTKELYGELWRDETLEPVWSGYVSLNKSCSCFRFPIKLPYFGSYIFTAAVPDSPKVSHQIPIRVFSKDSVLPFAVKPRDVVFLP